MVEGLSIQHRQTEYEYRQQRGYGLISSLLLTAGFVSSFCSCFASLQDVTWMYVAGGLGLVMLYLILCPFSWKKRVAFIGCSCMLLAFFAGYPLAMSGIHTYFNELLSFLTGKTATVFFHYTVREQAGVYYTTALVTGWLALVISQQVYYQKTAVLYVMFLLLTFAWCFGICSKLYPCILFAGGLAMEMLPLSVPCKNRKGRWNAIVIGALILALCAGLSILGGSFLHVDTENWLKKGKRQLHTLLCDDFCNAMPEGNLSNVNYLVKAEQTALEIQADTLQKLYLRGFVGDTYTGTSWDNLEEEALRCGADLFYWLHKKGFYGQTAISKGMCALENPDVYSIRITNVSACSGRQYLPYGLWDSGSLEERSIGDGTARAKQTVYTYSYVAGSVPKWYETALSLSLHQQEKAVLDYLQLEHNYRDFVYQQNLSITNAAAGVCQSLFGNETKERYLGEILELVRKTLQKETSYNDGMITLNENNDFFQYFMEQSKEGYSVHYATAAAVMLRYFGVPSRYVEGYYLSEEQAAVYEPGETIPIPEANAHAWAEYYLDGVGWIPFETTPGYMDAEEQQAAQTVVQGNGEAGKGKTYQQNPLNYKQPPAPREDLQTPDAHQRYRFSAKWIWYTCLLLVLLLAGTGLVLVWKRRRRWIRFWKRLDEMEHKDAVAQLYGYSRMLWKRCQLPAGQVPEEIRILNQEAMFCDHSMGQDKRQQMLQFTKDTMASCKKTLSLPKYVWYHFFLWIL